MITVDEIGGPGRVVGRGDHRVEVELLESRVDAVDAGEPIDLECLVVGHPAEYRLRIVGSGCERLCLLKHVLIKKRHLHVSMRVVEVDGALQRASRHRHTDASGEVRLDVVAEIEVQHQGLAASRSMTVAPAAVSASTASSNASSTGCGVGTNGSNPPSPARVRPRRAPWRPLGFKNCVYSVGMFVGRARPFQPSGTLPVAGSRPSSVRLWMTPSAAAASATVRASGPTVS